MYICSYNKLSCGTVTVLVPSGGTPQETPVTIKKNSYRKNNACTTTTWTCIITIWIELLVRYVRRNSLLQEGGEGKDQEPSDRHWVVSESLVSYPVKQL